MRLGWHRGRGLVTGSADGAGGRARVKKEVVCAQGDPQEAASARWGHSGEVVDMAGGTDRG